MFDKDYIQQRIVISERGCWEWQGSIGTDGYGSMNAKSCGEHSAHRLSYKIHKGDIPMFGVVRHTCDNRSCCNPEHLVLGSHSDNALDAFDRGRRNHTNIKQASLARRIPQATIDEALSLNAKGVHYEAIGKQLNISRSTAYKIISLKGNLYVSD